MTDSPHAADTMTNAERARVFDLAEPEPMNFGSRPTRLQVEVGPGFVSEWHPISDEVPVRIVRVSRPTNEEQL